MWGDFFCLAAKHPSCIPKLDDHTSAQRDARHTLITIYTTPPLHIAPDLRPTRFQLGFCHILMKKQCLVLKSKVEIFFGPNPYLTSGHTSITLLPHLCPAMIPSKFTSNPERNMDTRHLNPFQLARRWGVTSKTLQNWRCKRRGPPFLKIGGHVLYRQDDIEQFESKNYHR